MWMKVDDGLHAHRKTRAALKSRPDKMRDAGAIGIWTLAGSWAAQNRTDGWVPEDELDRWDDDWETLVDRLVKAGFWWPYERNGEAGYGFTDWHDYNDPTDMASKSGTYGNHVRWHVNEKRVDPACDHCPKEPDEPEDRGDVAPDIGGRSGGESQPESGGESRNGSGAIALPVPEPDPNPSPKTSRASADAERMSADFDVWWDAYPRKVGKGSAVKAYKAARKKTDAETLVRTLRQQTPALSAKGVDFIPYPATWLNGERWLDEAPRALTAVADPSELPPRERSWMERR